MEMMVENKDEGEHFWVIFIHASTDARERKRQWEILKGRRYKWGSRWVMGETLMK